MIGLFEVTYTRQGYGKTSKEKSTQKTEMFLETFMKNKKPFHVPTNRLGGFQQDHIEVLETKFIREQFPLEIIDIDIEGNDLTVIRTIHSFLKDTLDDAPKEISERVTELILNEEDLDIEEAMEKLCYVQVVHDNTYNCGSDLEDELNYRVFQLKDNQNNDWIYDEDALIWIERHIGLDVRAGYSELGLYQPGGMDGLCDFLIRQQIQVEIFEPMGDNSYSEVEFYDGDGAIYSCLEDYKLSHVVDHGPDLMPEIFVKDKDGKIFEMRLW